MDRAQWRRAEIGELTAATASICGIQHIFPKVYEAAGKPHDIGIFQAYDAKRGSVVLYFSPSAHQIAEIYSATPCAPPARIGGLKLVCGDPRCWECLRPVSLAHAIASAEQDQLTAHALMREPGLDVLVPPAEVTFDDLHLEFDRESGTIGCERSALAALCDANGLEPAWVLGNDEMAGWMIAQWYRMHRDGGGPADRVAESLLSH
jgi:hypothetical protein